MSGKEFFENRYRQLGWEYKPAVPRQAIRVNCMNIDKSTLLERLKSRGVLLEKIDFLEDGYWVCKSKFSVGATAEYLLGLYSVQEAAAQIPATLFTKLEDKKTLDACAAPGGKTVQLADLMRNSGVIVALDIEKQRLKALSNQLERCRVKNAIVYEMDARRASELGVKFERVLLDVPCSGNFAADKTWFDRRTIKDVESNAQLQREILAESVKILNHDGELVYSTCSLEPEEDELNIDWAIRNLGFKVERINCCGNEGLTRVLGKRLDNSIQNCKRIWPSHTQGFFVCKLQRRA